jgi:hypothetical protein
MFAVGNEVGFPNAPGVKDAKAKVDGGAGEGYDPGSGGDAVRER